MMELGTDLSYSAWGDASTTVTPNQSPAAATTSSELELPDDLDEDDDKNRQKTRELFAMQEMGKTQERGQRCQGTCDTGNLATFLRQIL